MNIAIFRTIKSIARIKIVRHCSYASVYKNELNVSQFCKLFIKCPFTLEIRPLDMHIYTNSDKLFINVLSKESDADVSVKCEQNDENVHIVCESSSYKKLKCYVEAPIKSDLSISSTHGNIDVKKFKGFKILLKTDNGDIQTDNCENAEIKLQSSSGNIKCKGTLHASNIKLKTCNSGFREADSSDTAMPGQPMAEVEQAPNIPPVYKNQFNILSIDANHIQALCTDISTEDGDISVKSVYCDSSSFSSENGNMTLDNVHKLCNVNITRNGSLKMTGFDGSLQCHINSGHADLQISCLRDRSEINVAENGSVKLRLSDNVEENCKIKIMSESVLVSDELSFTAGSEDKWTTLVPPKSESQSELVVNSKLSNVNIDKASWSDMLKLKGINFSD